MQDSASTAIFQDLAALSESHPLWGRLYASALPMALAQLSDSGKRLLTIIAPDSHTADLLEQDVRFFLGQKAHRLLHLPDWETLPYDLFSPHEEIISQRLEVLQQISDGNADVLILPVSTLMQRIAPPSFLLAHCFSVKSNDRLNVEKFRERLGQAGYSSVNQVLSHGEMALRGSLLDIYPMGSPHPFRIDLFDDEIDSIRSFDPETQKSTGKVDSINLLPAHEFPLDEPGIKEFRRRYRERFEGDPQRSKIYSSVSNGIPTGGIEYYLPLFFDAPGSIFDYLPENTQFCVFDDFKESLTTFFADVEARYEQRSHDIERPLLEAHEIYLRPDDVQAAITAPLELQRMERAESDNTVNFSTARLTDISIKPRLEEPATLLKQYLQQHSSDRILFTADSTGRREHMLDTLQPFGIKPKAVADWHGFQSSDAPVAICVAPLEEGVYLPQDQLCIIPETHLFLDRTRQKRKQRKVTRDSDAIIRNLSELHVGAPVVHEEHGVGRYIGLQLLNVGGYDSEFLTLEYSNNDKLYVPVSALHLISRFTGADADTAPLHKLGSDQWGKAKRKAAQKAHDAAAELLDIYARRAARKGYSYPAQTVETEHFAAGFPFEETDDQASAIEAVLNDLQSELPMDRVVCGDVGFGKTEVAMRAAFTVANTGKQVAVLVPTTLLAQQHGQNFADRFSDWPFRIEALSRFRSPKEQKTVLDGITDGTVDIVIGTHKLLQKDISFKDLGLVIIDEEQRFGVRHKERLKSMRSEVDILTLTATPIPRTLNMSLAGLRDLSIIATPPMQRHAIKTFVSEWNGSMINEACLREIRRGGQVYFLHNEVKSIEKAARELEELVPEADIRIAHGQMRESELEQVMLDFIHQRFNVLVCTTIIETGIDLPSANTIIINRADKFGLSQLHQLRGRVGRSHHRAYAYMIAPHKKSMTKDALKRLEAIESLEDLGVGFTLATHDLEIRGAGELLGDEQSGQIHEVGFSMYNDLLERAVKALKSGETPDLEAKPRDVADVDLGQPALLPNDYIGDIHTRLILYKRIAAAPGESELDDLQIELIDRFGLLPDAAKTLFAATRLKLKATELGVRKIDVGPTSGRLLFTAKPKIDVGKLLLLIQTESLTYKLEGQEKLKFVTGELEPDELPAWLDNLLDRLSPDK